MASSLSKPSVPTDNGVMSVKNGPIQGFISLVVKLNVAGMLSDI